MGFKEDIAALVQDSTLSNDALQDAVELLQQKEAQLREGQGSDANEKTTYNTNDTLKKTDVELKKVLIGKLKSFLQQRPKTSSSSSSSSSSSFFSFSAQTKQLDQPSKAEQQLASLDAAIQAYEQTPKLKQAFQTLVAERINLIKQFEKDIDPAAKNIASKINQSLELFKSTEIAVAQLKRYVELTVELQLLPDKTQLELSINDEAAAQRANCLAVLRGQLKEATSDTTLTALLSQLEKSCESERLPLEKKLLSDLKGKDQEISVANRKWTEKKRIAPETWFDWSLLVQKTLRHISTDILWDILEKDINPNVLDEQKTLGNQAQIAEKQTEKSQKLTQELHQLKSRAPSVAKSQWTNNYRYAGDEVGPMDDLFAATQFLALDEILVPHILAMQLRELSPKAKDPDQDLGDEDDVAQSASVTGTTLSESAEQLPKMTAEQVQSLLRRLVHKEITPLDAILEYKTYPDAQYSLAFSKLMINLAMGLLKLVPGSDPYVPAGTNAQGDARIFYEVEKYNTLAEALADERPESLLYFDLELSKQFYQKAQDAELSYSFASEADEDKKKQRALVEKRCMGELVNKGRLKLNNIVRSNRTSVSALNASHEGGSTTQLWDDSLPAKKVSLHTPTHGNVYTNDGSGSGFVPKSLSMNNNE